MSQSPSGALAGEEAPSPLQFLNTLNAFHGTAALKAAVELDLFTAIGEGCSTPSELASRCEASERGLRILCDYLTILGFLIKTEGRYQLTRDSGVFLDRRSPAYFGGVVEFLLSPTIMESFAKLTEAVRRGGTATSAEGTMEAEHPVWVNFARAMMPMMARPAQEIPGLLSLEPERKIRVLDLAAGHGLFGLAFAQQFPNAEVTAVDWAPVLAVAEENARKAGVADRFHTLPGSAFDVEYGSGYDIILLTNFLHHFDQTTCEQLLRKVHAAMADGGRAVTLEFVPNEDRVSPPGPATFSLVMLASTANGDAYTFAEYDAMFRKAGFSRNEIHPLQSSIQQVVVSHK